MRLKTALALAAVAVIATVAPVAQADETLRIDAVGYVPAAFDPAIPEYPRKPEKNWDFGNPDLGGILTVVVANDGDADADVEGVTVDGTPLAAFLAATCQDAGLACQASPPREMAWARWLPSPVIPAGGAAVFQLKRTADVETTVGFAFDGGAVLEATTPEASPVRLGLVYRDGIDVVAIVRNESEEDADLEGVRVAGASVAFDVLGGGDMVPAGRTAIVRILGAGAEREGAYLALTVATSEGDATVGMRTYSPSFPIGNWITSGWNDPTFLADVRDHHIDTVWGYARNVATAREYKFRLIADAVPCLEGQTSGCIAPEDEDVVAVYAYGDEVEFGRSAQEVMANLERRRLESDRPTYINDAAQRVFQVFAGQADIGSMDHYTSGIGLCTISGAQPATMQGQPIEWAGNYTYYLKRNVEPNPAWVWSQAGNKKTTADSCWHGLPTVDEMRAQLFSELANGAKGTTWFIFGSYADVDPSPALWAEAGLLGATLSETRAWLSTGDLDPGALLGSSPDLEVGVVSAPDAVVVPVLDLSYREKPKGYVWSSRDDVEVEVALPAWLAEGDVSVWQVIGGVWSEVDAERDGDAVTARIDALDVGTVLVILPAA